MERLYNLLINRHPAIQARYHALHDGSSGAAKIRSWGYLLWLNFAYYVLRLKSLRDQPMYEEKSLPLEAGESQLALRETGGPEEVFLRLQDCDTVSFDIFDTLLLRPFDAPTDLFYFLGAELGVPDFKRLRREAERGERRARLKAGGSGEVTLADIWARLEREVGVPAAEGMRLEQALETRYCYANPFMREVFLRVRAAGKRLIAVSDMYLPGDFLRALLEAKGFDGLEGVFVSCEAGCGKAGGQLFRKILAEGDYGRVFHIGDNEAADVQGARAAGLSAWRYPPCGRNALKYRPYDMSPLVGSAYRAVADNYLYTRAEPLSMEAEFGFLYGGLFALGYCRFIHEYCRTHGVQRVLFLARDGDVLRQVYELMYPGADTRYVLWSRAAQTRLTAAYNRHDFFQRFIFAHINRGKTLRQVLETMELAALLPELEGERDLRPGDALTDRNAGALRDWLLARYDRVLACYDEQRRAAEACFRELLEGCETACAVDIGWAGSGPLAIADLAEREWKLPVRITGVVAGTNTPHSAEPDATEPFRQTGRLTAYMFSEAHNRDLLKKHDPTRLHNVYWELLLSSPTPHFAGYAFQPDGRGGKAVRPRFGAPDANQEGSRRIQEGILAFAREYLRRFGDSPMLDISGRDAAAPMLLALSHGERYLKEIARRFSVEINVD